MGKKVYVEGIAMYARTTEEGRDMGKNLPEDSDQRRKIEECDGIYVLDLYVTEEAKKQAVADGLTTKGMTGQLWKENADGEPYYKCKRKHKNPKFTDRDTGEQGVVMGPPKVVLQTEDGNVEWDYDEMGIIGNNSRVIVKFDAWQDKIIEMEAIKVLEHVPYEGNQEGDF